MKALTSRQQTILDTLTKQPKLISARNLATLVPEINQATVYRTLDTLVKRGDISRYVFDGQEAMYENKSENHHHAICLDCNQVLHIDAPDRKILELLGIKNFEVDSLEVVVKGRHASH